MASGPADADRTRVAAWEGVCGLVMLIVGILMTRIGSVASDVGLGLLFLGVGGCGHAVLYALGLAGLPETEHQQADRPEDDDARD